MRYISYRTATVIVLIGLLSQSTFASSQPDMTSSFFNLQKGHAVVQLGGFWSDQGKAQAINIQYLAGNQYTVNNHHEGNGLLGIGYYFDGLTKERFQLAYGINGFYLGETSVSGNIVQEHLYTNLAYRYKIQNTPIYLAAKGNIKTKSERYNVIVDAGIGPNFMRTSQYSETALTSYTLPADNFASHNNVAFTATAGIGLQMKGIFGKAPIECGYRFFYLGRGQLAINNDQILNSINTGDTFANAIVCAISI